MTTKHRIRGNGLQFVLDTLHGDKVLKVVPKEYHSEGGVYSKTFRIHLPKWIGDRIRKSLKAPSAL